MQVGKTLDAATTIPSQMVLSVHNEMSYNPRPVNKIMLLCIEPAQQGGENLVAKNQDVVDYLAQHTDVLEDFEKKGGIRSVTVLVWVSCPLGSKSCIFQPPNYRYQKARLSLANTVHALHHAAQQMLVEGFEKKGGVSSDPNPMWVRHLLHVLLFRSCVHQPYRLQHQKARPHTLHSTGAV